jgi:hypothetical protein
MRPRAGVLLLTLAILAACGSGNDLDTGACIPVCAARPCGDDGCGGICGVCPGAQICVQGACVAACVATCSGKVCGDDGCGGSCGACPAGATCVQGACRAAASPGCPQGGRCMYLDRVAWRYDCTSADHCQPAGAIANYGTFEACQTWGCMGGNSRCGDQFGNPSDPERWSCERCKIGCNEGTPTACGADRETAEGCRLWDSVWGDYLADCICQ